MNENIEFKEVKLQRPGDKAVQGPRPVLHRTGRTVVGLFKPGSNWIKCVGNALEARLYRDWKPMYRGIYRCEVLDCARNPHPVLIPVVAATPEELWNSWDLSTFWAWVESNHPDFSQDKQAVEERFKKLVMYNAVAVDTGIMNLFNACRDGVALTDSMSSEDCNGVWKELNEILKIKPKFHDVHMGWRQDFIDRTWNKNLRHFVSFTSQRIFAAICDQTDDNCEYLWQVMQNWDYNTHHPLTDNYFLMVPNKDVPKMIEDLGSLREIKCKAVFADGSWMETNMHETLVEHRATCVNFTLIVQAVSKGVQAYPVREIVGSYVRSVFEHRPVLIYKYGNFYLKHPDTLKAKKEADKSASTKKE